MRQLSLSGVWCELARNTCHRNCTCENNQINQKLFPSIYRLVNNLLEEFFKHGVVDQFRSGAVHFDDFFLVRIERVKGAELAAAVAEQN